MSSCATMRRSGARHIGIVAGEASGDALGATLIHAVRRAAAGVRFAGIAGPKMEAAGCEAWASTEQLAVRGFAEVISASAAAHRAARAKSRARFLGARMPVFIGVDAPDFNLGLERRLKRRRVRTVHFVSPSVWAWRRERLKRSARAVDRMLALFPFEPPLYEAAGIAVTYVGHPLAQDAARPGTRREARETLKQQTRDAVVRAAAGQPALRDRDACRAACSTPRRGSRKRARTRGSSCRSSRARHATRSSRRAHRGGHDALPLTVLYGHAGDALRAADVALVASGTATLEAALARCPHVIFYRVSALTARIVRRKLLLPWVGLPNVLAGRFVVPELLQNDATPGNLAQAALNLFDDTVTRRRIETLFGEMSKALAVDTGAIAADAVVAELDQALAAPGS